MNDEELDLWLQAADPARKPPESLSKTVDAIVLTTDQKVMHSRWRPVVIAGGSLALVSALAAGTDLGSYVMSIPPFAGLEYGADSRTFDGLLYVPIAGQDQGEQCRLYLDLGGLTDDQMRRAVEYWPAIDPAEFAAGVERRLVDPGPSTGDLSSIESAAVIDETLARLDKVVPGIQWGAASPGNSFEDGDPHLVAITTLCLPGAEDRESLG